MSANCLNYVRVRIERFHPAPDSLCGINLLDQLTASGTRYASSMSVSTLQSLHRRDVLSSSPHSVFRFEGVWGVRHPYLFGLPNSSATIARWPLVD